MHIEIDQSIKIEYTGQATVVAFANGETYTILISAQVKRRCLEYLQQERVGTPRRQIRLFTAVLFLLLKDHISRIAVVTIDREYAGHDILIKDYLLNRFRRAGYQVEADQIQFANIGKKSPAHHAAINTMRGKRRPDKVIEEAELLAEL